MPKPDTNHWLNRIQYAENVKKDADDKYGYSRAIKQYQGDFLNSMPSFLRDTPIIPINEVYAFAKTFVASVYSRDPHISFNPQGKQSIASSKLLELAVNAYWRELRIKNQIKRCLLDAIFAEGWLKMGASAVFGEITPEEGAPPVEANEYIRDGEIFATRVSWRHIYRDPNAIDGIHDARWVAQKIINPYDAVIRSPLYTSKDI